MLTILQRNGITENNYRRNIATCPRELFFLTAKFLRENWGVAKLPPEKLDETVSFAENLQQNLRYRQLAWHLYNNYVMVSLDTHAQHQYPDIIDEFGIDSGKLYLLLTLALIPHYRQRAELEGYPMRFADAAADRIGTTTRYFAQKYDGNFGLRGSKLLFFMHFKETATYRIGRFDFVPSRNSATPYVYSDGEKILCFCGNNWLLNARGERVQETADAVRVSHFVCDGNRATGTLLLAPRGLADDKETTIDLNKWKQISAPEDWTLFFHIPGGGGMTPEVCESSFREAMEFFAEFMPEKKFTLIWSSSWIFNPEWVNYMPHSNMSKLIRRGTLFTVPYTRTEGMYFIFGSDDKPLDTYPQQSSVERALISCLRDHGTLYRSGWFIVPEEIGKK